ncbi:MAG: sulfatase-like hydrolase/transferase, partial [Geminicoccaceae bacterium]
MRFPRPRAWLGPRLLVTLAVALSQNQGPAASEPVSAGRPNIVLIMTDDEDVGIHQFMPKTKALLEDRGTTFDNFFVSYPFCCPSRASILRGQYAHNTHIVGNEQPWGGFEKFRLLGLEESTVATWLQAAGYHTAMIGKYLNRYVPERDGVPPGWDEWYVGGNAHVSYNYLLNENGRTVAYGDGPEDYLNDVLTGKAVQAIRNARAAGQPFFVYVLPFTPHSPSVAAPRHEGM